MILLTDLLRFILKHPKKDILFRDYTINQIASDINQSLLQGGLCVIHDENEKVQGIVAGLPDHGKKVLFISFILIDTSVSGVVQNMLMVFKNNFSGYSIEAYRDRCYMKYNTDRLVRLFNKLAK